MRAAFFWALLVAAMVIPIGAAAFSPLLAWRDPIYIMAGFAGIIGMALMLVQPLLAAGYLPGLTVPRQRQLHRMTGGLLVFAVMAHVIGLWVTSPPDVIDVLLFRSPTPFSIWGVVAMWAVFAAATVGLLRKRLPLRLWRVAHTVLVSIAVVGTVVHALRIDGTMESATKIILCVLLLAATIKAIGLRRAWVMRTPRSG